MPNDAVDGEVVTPQSVDEAAGYEWRQLSAQVREHRRKRSTDDINVTLEAAAERDPASPLSGVYRLWMAEVMARRGDYAGSLALYDIAADRLGSTQPFVATIDGVGGALQAKAQAAALSGDTAEAVKAYQDLGHHLSTDPQPLIEAALLWEKAGDRDAAASLYGKVIAGKKWARAHAAHPAARNLERLQSPDSAFLASYNLVVDAIEAALASGSGKTLRKLASKTHFHTSAMCGESHSDGQQMLDRLCAELSRGTVHVHRPVWGKGDKRYLLTSGWRGRWFKDDVIFLINRSARGWQWVGCAIATPNDLWLDHWTAKIPRSNDPLPFELLAPFPAGLCCRAGGLEAFFAEKAAIATAIAFLPWPVNGIVAAGLIVALSARDCGFGPGGLYYGTSPTHENEDYFAVDFTRYQRFVPYINRSYNTPVLAPRGGIVSRVSDGTSDGQSPSNTVEIQHGDPADPTNTDRFTTRYLHMRGPKLIEPMLFDPIFTGNRIGLMDNTGRSVDDHLHFSIHDRRLPFGNYELGSSVRPTPMNGITLGDGDAGTCICSTNVETEGPKPMIIPQGYAVQNWTITPVATAVGRAPPANIREQRFQLVLSGVALLDMKGVSGSQWRHETLLLYPDLRGPAKFVIDNFGLPKPPGFDEQSVNSLFQVEQWAPFASLGSIYNANESIHSGFAVDAWRPQPFGTATDLATNASISNLFAGIQADLAVRDSDAYLYRIGYHITLIGRPIFTQVVIL